MIMGKLQLNFFSASARALTHAANENSFSGHTYRPRRCKLSEWCATVRVLWDVCVCEGMSQAQSDYFIDKAVNIVRENRMEFCDLCKLIVVAAVTLFSSSLMQFSYLWTMNRFCTRKYADCDLCSMFMNTKLFCYKFYINTIPTDPWGANSLWCCLFCDHHSSSSHQINEKWMHCFAPFYSLRSFNKSSRCRYSLSNIVCRSLSPPCSSINGLREQ